MEKLFVKTLEVGMFHTNCYIVMDKSSCDGFVIDPGAEARKIISAVTDAGVKCKAILCTHGHMDHVGAAGKVAEALNARLFVSRIDSGVLDGSARGIGGRLSSMIAGMKSGDVEHLEASQIFEFGAREIKVVPTPGHTLGSMSFIAGDSIFCGDLVFQGSIGRTDLSGGSLSQLLASVRKHVWTLPGDARIFPGHGPATTVRAEKATNPYLHGIEREC
ncbi:MAG: MBL fold metallo-hydrolase [Candidatus Anoxymicrobium japonicum]|uniref:MBL fold metallo-hydrolase n=1 Tax=Candidatus Anoxymicrobium japonicum TaxID=2013648 RepID=A0A2N3G896_9ACTN|nr:MAG: MBL fold metallo-hydrolase [Candidatus Anoxymicrobium japonicum]